MRWHTFILIPLFMLAGRACGPSVRLYSDVESATSFGDYKTYSFLEFSEGNQKTITGMELERLRVAVARELEERGLDYAAEKGDVSVKVVVYHRRAHSYHPYYRGYRPMERAIAVDMYDNRTRRHIWHCAAVGDLEYDPERRAEHFPEVAASMFERYPVAAPQAAAHPEQLPEESEDTVPDGESTEEGTL